MHVIATLADGGPRCWSRSITPWPTAMRALHADYGALPDVDQLGSPLKGDLYRPARRANQDQRRDQTVTARFDP
jgi:hypothetical protein